jgi:hypothetical protein
MAEVVAVTSGVVGIVAGLLGIGEALGVTDFVKGTYNDVKEGLNETVFRQPKQKIYDRDYYTQNYRNR